MSELTLKDIAEQLSAIQREQIEIKKDLKTIKQPLRKLDSRFFEFSMRVVSPNQSAFYSVGLALLSVAIAFVFARVSSGSP